MKANEIQVGGEHYRSSFQHWDFVQMLQISYLPAQIDKYLTRWRKKNGLQDLEKAGHFLDKFIEVEKERHQVSNTFMNNFLRANDILREERDIINMLVQYQLGDVERLDVARAGLTRLIDLEKQRLADKPPAKEHDCC